MIFHQDNEPTYNINPFTDFGFKKIFGQPGNEDIMIAFLNDLLCNEKMYDPIVDINYMHTERVGDSVEMRNFIFDIRCKTQSGHTFIVEMQKKYFPHFSDRMTVYSAAAIVDQMRRQRKKKKMMTIEEQKRARSYELQSVYVVAICNFVVDASRPWVKLSEGKCDLTTGNLVDDRQRYIYIQLPYFDKNTPEECETNLDKWLYTLKKLPTMKENPFAYKNKVFARIMAVADEASLTDDERYRYEKEWDNYLMACEYEEMGRKEGRKEGLREGHREGLEEGKIEELRSCVQSMRRNGFDNGRIAEILGKNPELIASL